MKKRFTEEQKAFALRQAESGVPVQEILRKMGISEPTVLPLEAKIRRHGRGLRFAGSSNLRTRTSDLNKW